jgi:hypothetical protein
MTKLRFLVASVIFAGLFMAGSAAFCAPKHASKKQAKKADAQSVTILDMSGSDEPSDAMPTISKKGPL